MTQSKLIAALMLLLSIFLVGCNNDDSGSIVDPNVTQTIGAAGGTFNFQSSQVRLVVPAGSLSGNTNVSVRAATGFPADARLVAGTAWTVSTDSGATFSSPATLRFHYASLPLGADPASLKIFRLVNGTWVEVTSTVDTTNQNVSAQITQAGTYAIFVTGGMGSPDVFRTFMNSEQEVHEVAGPPRAGRANVSISEDGTSIQVTLNVGPEVTASNVTAAHFHVGRLNEAGPVAATIYNSATMGAFTDPYTRTITAADLNVAVMPTMAQLIAGIRDGSIYVNVHTEGNPQGVMRGQLGTSLMLSGSLSGDAVVPPVTTAATGTATVTLDRDMTHLTVNLNTTGLVAANVKSASIRLGAPGQEGPVLFRIFTENSGAFTNSITITFDETDFVTSPDMTYEQAIGALLAGRTYIDVRTTTNTGGEIRGQIVPPLL